MHTMTRTTRLGAVLAGLTMATMLGAIAPAQASIGPVSAQPRLTQTRHVTITNLLCATEKRHRQLLGVAGHWSRWEITHVVRGAC